MLYEWVMDGERFKKTCIKEKGKGEASTSISTAQCHISSGLHAETGCRKVYAGKICE